MRINALLPHTMCRVVSSLTSLLLLILFHTTQQHPSSLLLLLLMLLLMLPRWFVVVVVVVFFLLLCCSFFWVFRSSTHVRHFQLLWANRPQPQCIILNAKFTWFWLQHEVLYIQSHPCGNCHVSGIRYL